MIMEDGSPLEGIVSLPSPGEHDVDLTEYTSLKRSLSRVHKSGARPAAASSTLHPHHLNNDFRTPRTASPAGSMHLDIPTFPMAGETALAALEHMPTPLLVLSSLKTVVLANEAMGRLLGLRNVPEQSTELPEESVTDILRGQTLSQIGIDMISDGVPIWVSWEKFLDNLAAGLSEDDPEASDAFHTMTSGETTPTAAVGSPLISSLERGRSPTRNRSLIEDTVVDVIVSTPSVRSSSKHGSRPPHRPSTHKNSSVHATCRMIISIWTLHGNRYFTLTFTSPSASSTGSSNSSSTTSVPRAKSRTSTRSTISSHSHTPSSSRSSSVVTSPSEVQLSTTTNFPPAGSSVHKVSQPATFTDFQKVTRMKDAMLNAVEIPVLAMWRDESVVFPNQAARRLLAVTADPTTDDSYDFMSRFRPWTADFERELDEHENPIIKLCRTQKAFTRWQIGLINEKTGKRSCYDVSGHPVTDNKTGEFYAGLITFKDVTEYTERIATQTAENEQQFQLICDTMPQMLWTTRPDGYHDYFSQRWYDYTGLSVDECMGLGWQLPFHEDDMPETGRRWGHSLATGEEYLTEYRCRRYDGEWRWMLGRALPLRDAKTGDIVKWFGTCTDIQDIVDAREASQQARHQLVDVLKHAQMTMWIIDKHRQTTFFEGDVSEQAKREVINKPAGVSLAAYMDRRDFTTALDKILEGRSELELLEIKEAGERWSRLRLVPQRGEKGPNGLVDDSTIIGVAGISMDVTQSKMKEAENIKLLANESAAKEASKMKSNFLANMSHEIRTPIAGVLGMSELLMDTELDAEQSDFAQNIQRSANSLLTVINDILDFSKIESGRLDIEEVQFSLPVVLKDVAKMLSYAAQRKNLEFTSDLQLGATGDLALLGDPGRIRQILTNLLTNSIKFTSDGFVKMTVQILEDTPEATVIGFQVEDTGIGIEEEVQKRLFRPFSQADSSTARRFGGTGLGLTISKNLVDLMHGEIKLESKLDHGTKATFKIPFKKLEFAAGTSTPLVEIGALPDRLHSELSLSCNNSTLEDSKTRKGSPPINSPRSLVSVKAYRASNVPTITSEVDRNQFHILVVEDNPVNQQIAIRFIKSLKFSVSAVWNGKEALEYLLKATDPDCTAEELQQYRIPSLILMDCQMPVLDGYHTTHVLRHHAPYNTISAIAQTPIIAMTASAIQGDKEKCQRAGMDDYLAKPVKRPILEKMILKWIAGHAKRPGQRKSDSSESVSPIGGPLKPALSRTGTDHSSNCADLDQIAAEVLRSKLSAAATAHPLEVAPLRPPLTIKASSSEQQRRSSLSRNILASGIPGAETEAQRGMRRVEAEEKATSLRDAKLLAATEPGMGVGGLPHVPTAELYPQHAQSPGLTESILSPPDPFSTNGSPLPRSYPQQGTSESARGVLALTEENVQRLNRDAGPASSPGVGTKKVPNGADGYFGTHNVMDPISTKRMPSYTGISETDKRGSIGDNMENFDVDHNSATRPLRRYPTIPNIPGPPPEMASPIRPVSVNTKVVDYLNMADTESNAQHDGPPRRPNVLKKSRKATKDSDASADGRSNRPSTGDQKRDWSNSTVRPENT